MPHITIEYSANIADHREIQPLVDAVHSAALTHGLPALAALRTRAAKRDNYRIADGQPDHAFVALTARIGPGRSAADKTSFLEAILAAAESHLAEPVTRLGIAYSAEVQEIDADFRINHNHVRTRMEEQA